mgnify:CR=1 FL=1
MHFNKTTCEQIKSLFQIIWVKKLSKYIINALISESTKSLRVNYAELMEKNLVSCTQINDIVNYIDIQSSREYMPNLDSNWTTKTKILY